MCLAEGFVFMFTIFSRKAHLMSCDDDING